MRRLACIVLRAPRPRALNNFICRSQVTANEAAYYSLIDINLQIWRLEEALRAKEGKLDEESMQ